jgi:DNA-directed RNA polymerase specialized sigma24 family protein
VVVLRFFYDWSVDQTADALAISPGTVKSRLSRALQDLNRRLGVEEDEDGGLVR